MSYKAWWRGLPAGLKPIFLFVTLPAWLVIVYCVLMGQNKSPAAYTAFGVFAAAALLHIIFDRRRFGPDRESDITFDGGSDGD